MRSIKRRYFQNIAHINYKMFTYELGSLGLHGLIITGYIFNRLVETEGLLKA